MKRHPQKRRKKLTSLERDRLAFLARQEQDALEHKARKSSTAAEARSEARLTKALEDAKQLDHLKYLRK